MPQNHNHLRITRIIRSLRILGLGDVATKFFAALHDINEEVPGQMVIPKNVAYWASAATQRLWKKPDPDWDADKDGDDDPPDVEWLHDEHDGEMDLEGQPSLAEMRRDYALAAQPENQPALTNGTHPSPSPSLTNGHHSGQPNGTHLGQPNGWH